MYDNKCQRDHQNHKNKQKLQNTATNTIQQEVRRNEMLIYDMHSMTMTTNMFNFATAIANENERETMLEVLWSFFAFVTRNYRAWMSKFPVHPIHMSGQQRTLFAIYATSRAFEQKTNMAKMRTGEREEEEKVKEIGFARNVRMRTAKRTQAIGSNVL